MTRLIRLVPWALGVCVVGASLLGAKWLLQSDAPPAGAGPAAAPAAAGAVTVLGTVASDPPDAAVGPPAVAALVTVAEVFVTEGQAVKVGDKLVQFDDALAKPKVAQAEAELLAAREDVVKAGVQKLVHPIQVAVQELTIRTADEEVKRAEGSLEIGRRDFERLITAPATNPRTRQQFTEPEREAERRDNLELRKGESDVNVLRAKAAGERKKLEGLVLTPVDADVRAAAAKVARLVATVAEANAAVDAHLLKARTAGVVEQVFAVPGMTYGPASRTPVLHLVPAGKRVIRAEVEAEFVARVANSAGKAVTILDANDFSLKYPGVVRLIGTAFHPKRSQADGLALNPVQVLECVIDVPDPSPAGKPPLRVGQPVRVSFP